MNAVLPLSALVFALSPAMLAHGANLLTHPGFENAASGWGNFDKKVWRAAPGEGENGSTAMLYELKDGSAAAISTGKYFTPKGISLEGVGITPDLEVPVDDGTYLQIYYDRLESMEDPQILAALELLK